MIRNQRARYFRRSAHTAWLLCLALLFPLAQSAAALHALSHPLAELDAAGSGKHAPHGGACMVCVAGAGLTGGALPAATVPVLAAAPVADQAPAFVPTSVRSARIVTAYLSQAPPAPTSH